MKRQEARTGGAANKRASIATPQAMEDVERLTRTLVEEAKTSLPKAGRVIGKVAAVYTLGFVFASNCCLPRFLVPIGVVALAIASGWIDAIGHECKKHLFFPYKALNSVGASLFRWQWTVVWACVFYALNLPQFGLFDRLWTVSTMAVVPLVLMLLGRALQPYQFRGVRTEIQKAEALARQLVSMQKVSDVSALAPLIESEKIPLYKLGSVAKLLYGFVASHDVTGKLFVQLEQPRSIAPKPFMTRLISTIYSPFRAVASDLLLWENRDVVLYIAAAFYLALVYTGSFYFPDPVPAWASWCLIVPFLGPKSTAGQHVRALQQNIRLAQGAAAEKKGGMSANTFTQDYLPRINWPMMVYIGSVHLTALYALLVLTVFGGVCPLFGQKERGVKAETLVMAAVLYFCSALGITAGVHRLWSHRSYKAGLPLKMLLMLFNSMANQGTIFHWARDHRVHHLYSDTIADPHDANRGFWFSHVGWLLLKKHPSVQEAGSKVNVSDLLADPVVMFQKRADPFWNLFWCFGLPAFLSLAWHDSFWNGFLVGGVLRYVLMLNATWAVNSVVHCWGTKPYNSSHLTTENGWVSLFAIGEGWHNWHHAFSYDYACAELGALSQFNPTKVFIDVMAFLGFAWDRKRALEVWATRKARWQEAQRRPVEESLEGPPLFKRRVVTFGPAYEDEQEQDN